MKRRTLDVAFSIGGTLLAVMLFVLGLVLSDQASFAETYVTDQLLEQQIKFPEEYTRGELDVQNSDCLREYAGTKLDSGKKAECYANFYIKTHMGHSADDAGLSGETYSTLGGIVSGLKKDLETATAAGEDTAALEEKIASASSLRETMFKGETLRGLLLTTYGFSIFGDRADLAKTVCYLGAALLLILSMAGFVHAFTSRSAEKTVV